MVLFAAVTPVESAAATKKKSKATKTKFKGFIQTTPFSTKYSSIFTRKIIYKV